jgi:replicative DNA helicase
MNLPTNESAEAAVLGAIILNPDIRPKMQEMLEPEDFYLEKHRLIFQTLLSLQHIPDATTIIYELQKRGIHDKCGGNEYIGQLMDAVSISAGAGNHAKIVKELAQRRALIEACQRTIDQIGRLNNPIDGIISDHRNQLTTFTIPSSKLRRGVDITNVFDAGRMVDAYREYNETLKQNRFVTGIHEIDKRIRGVAGGEVLTIIARAGSFKTAFLQNLLKRYIQNSAWAAVFFSLEMPVSSLAERYQQIICGISGMDLEEAYTSNAEGVEDHRAFLESEFKKDLEGLYVVPSKVSVQDIPGYIRLIEAEHSLKVGLIGIDYLGLMDGPGKGEYEIISGLARDIKTTAKMINIPVILLSQVSRKGGSGDEEISLDYGRGSGAIEEGADFVLGLWQVEQHRLPVEDPEPEHNLICKILKNRKGPKNSRWKLDLDAKTLRIGVHADPYEPPKKQERDKF